MAIPRRIPFNFDDVFRFGAAPTSDVAPARDYKLSTKEKPVQAVDVETGLPLWQFDLMDLDPEAHKSVRIVTVKMAAAQQPVPVALGEMGPFKLVRLTGLQGSPYVKRDGDFSSLQWSFFATGFEGPTSAKNEKAA